MIFFDIDGTLLDFKAAERAGVQAVYAQYETKILASSDAFYEDWCRIGHEHYQRYLSGQLSFAQQQRVRVKGVFAGTSVSPSDERADQIFRVYLDAFEAHWTVFDDVAPCLQALRGRYRLGIISNGDAGQQTSKLRTVGIIDAFQTIVTSGGVGVAKPNPAIFLTACRRAGKAPSTCVYVGDSWETDIEPSLSVGMRAVWLRRMDDSSTVDARTSTIASLGQLDGLLQIGGESFRMEEPGDDDTPPYF